MSSNMRNPISAQAPMRLVAYAVAPIANRGPEMRLGNM